MGDFRFNIYPNPAGEKLSVSFIDSKGGVPNALVEIRNVSGQLVYKTSVSSQNPIVIDVSKYSGGIYFCSLISEEKKIIKKILVTGK